jgi:hypothetical protein
MSDHDKTTEGSEPNDATNINPDAERMRGRATSTPEPGEIHTLSESSESTPRIRSKAYVTASDSEGVAADVAMYGGARLYASALTSEDDMSDDDDEEAASDFGDDMDGEYPEDDAVDDAESDDAEASKDEDEHQGQATVIPANRTVLQKGKKKEETLTPHPKSPTKVITTLTVQRPDGSGTFTEIAEIPEIQDAFAAPVTGAPAVYFSPPLASVGVPREGKTKILKGPWSPDPTVPDQYTCTD